MKTGTDPIHASPESDHGSRLVERSQGGSASDSARSPRNLEEIDALRSQQERHERLARRHLDAVIQIWFRRMMLELSNDAPDESSKGGSSNAEAER